MTEFTPVSALVGGLLIGLSASLLLLLNGRIAGVSGIAAGVTRKPRSNNVWRWLFLAGLVIGAGVWHALSGTGAPMRENFPGPFIFVAGALTGYGTVSANGCTSGHGVCGLARFSVRSLVATAVFLGVALVTTYLFRHVITVSA
jgi:uncharacterized membrane protein YedE/YeeE